MWVFSDFWALSLLVSLFPITSLWAVTVLFFPKSQFLLLNSRRLPGSTFVPHLYCGPGVLSSCNWANSITVYFHSLWIHCPSLTDVYYLENHSSVWGFFFSFFFFLVLGIRRVTVTVTIWFVGVWWYLRVTQNIALILVTITQDGEVLSIG